MPSFTCDLSQTSRPFVHFWEHTVGSGHAPLALRADWQAQMLRCHNELGFQHVRFHALLSDEMGTLVCEKGKLIYSFFNSDRIMDFLISIGMRPFVELSFMPEPISSGSTKVFSYQANVTPPRNYREWSMLIHKLVSHRADRYGLSEVREWFFEVWNEPNLKAFWSGTQKEYFNLYRVTVNTLKNIDPLLKVGGPATAKNAWIPKFLDFCEKRKVPVDFISTHHYPTDAFGKVGADTISQLQHAPRNVMCDDAKKVHDQARGLPVYYTEWNISSNPRDPLHDQPFSAAYALKIVMNTHGLVHGYSFWTFSDIFNENYFPSVPFHGGFGLLNLYGIPKPVYRSFELLHHLGAELLTVEGSHDTVDAWMVRKEDAATLVLTNHAMPRHAIHTERVSLHFSGARRPRRAYVERIDDRHANPRALWETMRQPTYLNAIQAEKLKTASELVKEPQSCRYNDGDIDLKLSLPPHSVAAITIEFA